MQKRSNVQWTYSTLHAHNKVEWYFIHYSLLHKGKGRGVDLYCIRVVQLGGVQWGWSSWYSWYSWEGCVSVLYESGTAGTYWGGVVDLGQS